MTTDGKLAAILAAVQTDPGNRGLARDPQDNLFTATAGDFAAACRSLSDCLDTGRLNVQIYTGFFIPASDPPAFETDGPLGAVFLRHAFDYLSGRYGSLPGAEESVYWAMHKVIWARQFREITSPPELDVTEPSHLIWIERAGPGSDGRCYTMRGRDISSSLSSIWHESASKREREYITIGIGDGGNEIGMGKIPHETIVKNIPNGDLIHCRVPTDFLIVAGVSNWGAYALAAGIYVLRGVKPPSDLFDPDREREILEVMVREGPLVDGVTGKQTATVDGLPWEEYAKPLIRMREILEL
jgi:hypothetical protein